MDANFPYGPTSTTRSQIPSRVRPRVARASRYLQTLSPYHFEMPQTSDSTMSPRRADQGAVACPSHQDQSDNRCYEQGASTPSTPPSKISNQTSLAATPQDRIYSPRVLYHTSPNKTEKSGTATESLLKDVEHSPNKENLRLESTEDLKSSAISTESVVPSSPTAIESQSDASAMTQDGQLSTEPTKPMSGVFDGRTVRAVSSEASMKKASLPKSRSFNQAVRRVMSFGTRDEADKKASHRLTEKDNHGDNDTKGQKLASTEADTVNETTNHKRTQTRTIRKMFCGLCG